jgi:hypothetical protein
MAVDKVSFSLQKPVAEGISQAAAKFSVSKSQVVNEALKQMLPAFLKADSLGIKAIASKP